MMVPVLMNPHRVLEAAARQLAEGGQIDDLTVINDLLICIDAHKRVEFKDLSNI